MGSDSALTSLLEKAESPSGPLIIGASVAGGRHEKNQIPCEDAFASAVYQNVPIVAIADGLSSARFGGLAADIASRSCVDTVTTLLEEGKKSPEEIIRRAIRTSRDAVIAASAEAKLSISDFGTTILLLVIMDGKIWCGHIGDGVAVTINEGSVSLLSGPGQSEYANETAVLAAPDWERVLRISIREGNAAVIGTDGCQGALIRREHGEIVPYEPFILPLVKSLLRFIREGRDGQEAVRDLLRSDRMQQLSSDDMTLAIIYGTGGETG